MYLCTFRLQQQIMRYRLNSERMRTGKYFEDVLVPLRHTQAHKIMFAAELGGRARRRRRTATALLKTNKR
ncbi:hypothetical protein L596_030302 [Steinernema carpocapsae]|uniref:Uncharacterized protein n=1 Tax=Steinernema carpocapsae TaxID=34508 RepID=A0A4U5LP00_STECR|nr:hypothetical protein L596_030302 [Steinernema carpocapsae]